MNAGTKVGSATASNGVPGDVVSRSAAVGTSILADLTELAHYYRDRGLRSDELSEAEMRFVVGLTRYRFAPPAGEMLTHRAQVMVFGGAGTGKSTTANIVVGTDVADVNAQAGYTRHPTAFLRTTPAEAGLQWPKQLGPLARLDQPQAGSLDEDKYTVRAIEVPVPDPAFLEHHVVWDCPDLTSRDADHYAGRVIEIAALADVCIYVASDERYNDELPSKFLQAVLDAGTPTIVVLTKVSPYDADELTELFRTQVLGRLRSAEQVQEIYVVPTPLDAKIHELWLPKLPHGSALRKIVQGLTGELAKTRKRSKRMVAEYLYARRGRLLDPLARDVNEWRHWTKLVTQSADLAVRRYEREHLDRSGQEEFQEARDALLAALPFPGQYGHVWRVLEYLRVPYRALKAVMARYTDARADAVVDETVLLDRLREQLVDSLIVAVAGQKGKHPFWDQLNKALNDTNSQPFESIFQDLRAEQQRDLRIRQSETYDRVDVRLAQTPGVLQSLRVVRIVLDVVGLTMGGWVGYQLFGSSLWTIITMLLGLGLADDLARVLAQEYVRRDRDELLRLQRENVRKLFRVAYVDELLKLPKVLGERLQRMSTLSDRLPKLLSSLVSSLEPKDRS